MSTKTLLKLALPSILLLSTQTAVAGAFLRGSAGLQDRITHVKGYPTISNPTGGNYVLSVCLDPGSTPVEAEQSVRNAVAEFNRFQGVGNNGVVGNNQADFESMVMHEVGHCLGLDHNTLGPSELFTVGQCDNDPMSAPPDCSSAPELFFTNALPDATQPPQMGDIYNGNDGADNVRGSRDDMRGDDVNRHWFGSGINDPFAALPATVDQVTFKVDTSFLPGGHFFAEAATAFSPCSPAAAADTSLLRGQGKTGSVMIPVLCSGNFVRKLSRDDEATFRIARSGYDGTQGNTDDYTWQLQYIGRVASCDIPITFVPSSTTGFARCSVGLAIPGNGSGDAVITSASVQASQDVSWHYNQTDTTGSPPGSCIFRHGFENTTPACN